MDTPREFLQACIAAELTEVLSDEMLQLLGEGELYPLAVRFSQVLSDNEVDEEMRRARRDLSNVGERAVLSQIEATAEGLVRDRLSQVKTVVTNYYCDVKSSFDQFDAETAAELRDQRQSECKAELAEVQILRDRFEARATGPVVTVSSKSAKSRAIASGHTQNAVSFSTADRRHHGRQHEDELDARPA
ncbi:hypothetical protein [Halovivax cerinus]|uniref:Uncharacterized protein n=1 Tax=Halovivax cerinus TaxID=1487865 RepID=A0ABD5NLB9_9EURY|nr:hypothetical protein [Halovivax cerinus]